MSQQRAGLPDRHTGMPRGGSLGFLAWGGSGQPDDGCAPCATECPLVGRPGSAVATGGCFAYPRWTRHAAVMRLYRSMPDGRPNSNVAESFKRRVQAKCADEFRELFGCEVPQGWAEAWRDDFLAVKGIEEEASRVAQNLRRNKTLGPAKRFLEKHGIDATTFDLEQIVVRWGPQAVPGSSIYRQLTPNALAILYSVRVGQFPVGFRTYSWGWNHYQINAFEFGLNEPLRRETFASDEGYELVQSTFKYSLRTSRQIAALGLLIRGEIGPEYSKRLVDGELRPAQFMDDCTKKIRGLRTRYGAYRTTDDIKERSMGEPLPQVVTWP